jgi:hypothetical protein
MRILKNKKAWIKIIEAFVSILLIVGILLVFINSGIILEDPLIAKTHNLESSILREIQLNDSLRENLITAELPVNWSNFEDAGLLNIKSLIISKTPNYLNCQAKLCTINDICSSPSEISKNVYADSVIISATLQKYSPRQLKLFCWE